MIRGKHITSVLLSLLVVTVVCLLSYSNTFQVPFQFDDTFNIGEKPYVRDISAFLDPEKIQQYRSDGPYRMRTAGYFTLAVNYLIHGVDVAGYHVVNTAIHLINAILIYFLVLLTFRTPFFKSEKSEVRGQKSGVSSQETGTTALIALLTALLFVSHPVQTQAVTYIVQRLASLAALFYLLSLVMYIKWRLLLEQHRGSVEAQKAPGSRQETSVPFSYRLPPITFFSLSLLSAVLAMKTKEISFTLPVVIAVYEFLFFTGHAKKRILYLLPFLLTMLIIPLELSGLERPAGEVIGDLSETMRVQTDISRWDYLFTEFRVIVTYIRLLFFPVNQNLDYDYPVYHSFFEPNVFLSFLFLFSIFGVAVYLLQASRRPEPATIPYPLPLTPYSFLLTPYSRLAAFGIFWFFIALSVESSIIPITDVIFEHRLYLPSAGFFIAVTAAIFIVWEQIKGKRQWAGIAAFGGLGLIIITFSAATYARNNIWLDSVKLWEDVLTKSPSNARAHNNLGHSYVKQGRFQEAVREYQAALRLFPDDFQVHNNLGVAYKGLGRFEEAIREYQNVLRLQPDDGMAYYNIGNIFRELGDYEKAVQYYRTAIKLTPDTAVIHNNLGIAYIGQGNMKDAEREFRITLTLDPDFEPARRNLEMLLRENR